MTTQLLNFIDEKTIEFKTIAKKMKSMKASPERVALAQKAKMISYTLEFLPSFINNQILDPNDKDNTQKRWQFVNDVQNMLVYSAFTNQPLENCSIEFLLMVNNFRFMIEKSGIYKIKINWNNFAIKAEVAIDKLHPAQINFINDKYNINIPLPKADEEKANAEFTETMQEINSLLSANGISQIGF